MKFGYSVVALYSLTQGVIAWPSPSLQDAAQDIEARGGAGKHRFIAPKPGWKRSPCPGTNLLANHGFINRNGMNVTAEDFMQGFHKAFNLGHDETKVGSRQAMSICARTLGYPPGQKCTTELTIDMIAKHNAIEHDASLSRNDKFMLDNPDGDVSSFNMTIWNMTMDIIGEDTTHVNMNIANTMRLRRVEQAKQDDIPALFVQDIGASIKENAFLLSIFNDPDLGQDYMVNPQARKDWIHYFFVNERLPTGLGWRKPKTSLTNIMSLAHALETVTTVPPKTSAQPSTTTDSSTEGNTGLPTSTPTDQSTQTTTDTPTDTPTGTPTDAPSGSRS